MSRLLETEKDRRNQRAAQEYIEKLFNWELYELPIDYRADWLAIQDEAHVGLVEFKRRNYSHRDFDTVFLNSKKYSECKTLADHLGIPFYYVNQWDDKIGIIQPTIADVMRGKVRMVRSDYRDNTDDNYMMIHLPLDRFDFYDVPQL